MNRFDESILSFLNQFSQKFIIFDHLVVFLENSNLFKGAIFFAFFWAWWLQSSPDLIRRRKIILSTLVGCALAILIARILALSLPFRARPLNEAGIHFLHPSGISQHTLEKWSSLPSDHAALFFGLATGCFLISRKIGVLAAIYASVMIMLPRLYLGFHYPTDILAGGLIGVATVWIMNQESLREKIGGLGLGWLERHSMSFYVCFFMATFQFVVLFDDVRASGHLVIDTLRYVRTGTAYPD